VTSCPSRIVFDAPAVLRSFRPAIAAPLPSGTEMLMACTFALMSVAVGQSVLSSMSGSHLQKSAWIVGAW